MPEQMVLKLGGSAENRDEVLEGTNKQKITLG